MYNKELDFVWKVLGAFAMFGVLVACVLFAIVPPATFVVLYTWGEEASGTLYALATVIWLVAWAVVFGLLLVLEKKERARWR